MSERSISPATKAWGVLIGGIIAYDVLCPEGQTLSEGADRGMETRIGRAAITLGALATAGHVANLIPQKIDPIHQAVELRRLKLWKMDGLRRYKGDQDG